MNWASTIRFTPRFGQLGQAVDAVFGRAGNGAPTGQELGQAVLVGEAGIDVGAVGEGVMAAVVFGHHGGHPGLDVFGQALAVHVESVDMVGGARDKELDLLQAGLFRLGEQQVGKPPHLDLVGIPAH